MIDQEEIRESNVSSTPDVFRYAEGVYMQKTNLGGGSPFIRGLTGKQVLLMIDGVRLNNSFYRFGPHQYLNTVDLSLIDRIEVVRGPCLCCMAVTPWVEPSISSPSAGKTSLSR